MSYSELPVALENIIIDKVATVPTPINRKIDTSAPLEIGIAAKDGGKCERRRKPTNCRSCVARFQKELAKTQGPLVMVRAGTKKVAKVAKMEGGTHGSGKKGSKGQEKGGKGETRTCWTCGETGHIAAWCRKGGDKHVYAIDEDDSENVEE